MSTPALYLRERGRLVAVAPEQFGPLMEQRRKGNAVTRVPDIPIFDAKGVRIGEVSYNGRVWAYGKEVRVGNRMLCTERDAIGWNSPIPKGFSA